MCKDIFLFVFSMKDNEDGWIYQDKNTLVVSRQASTF